jgi:hypothetical protein
MLKYGRDKINKRKKDRLVEYVLNIMEEKIETELSIEQDELIKSEKIYFEEEKKQIESLEKFKKDWEIEFVDGSKSNFTTYSETLGIQDDIDLLTSSLKPKKIRRSRTKAKIESILEECDEPEVEEMMNEENEDFVCKNEINDSSYNELSTFENTKSGLNKNCSNCNVGIITVDNSKDLCCEDKNSKKNDSVSVDVQDSNLPCTIINENEEIEDEDEEDEESLEIVEQNSIEINEVELPFEDKMTQSVLSDVIAFFMMYKEYADILQKIEFNDNKLLQLFDLYEKNKNNMPCLFAISILVISVVMRKRGVLNKNFVDKYKKMEKVYNLLNKKFEDDWDYNKKKLVLQFLRKYS